MTTQAVTLSSKHVQIVAGELSVAPTQVTAATTLLDDGATVPFVARYRKEMTGSLDEVAIAAIRDRMGQLRELDKRQEAILKSLDEQGKLSDEIKTKVMAAATMATLEDIYLPFRPKRRTRATTAREKGLEPLAETLFAQEKINPVTEATKFLTAERGVASAEAALAGARDIIAEWISENQEARAKMRHLFLKHGRFQAKVIAGKEEAGAKYKDYFAWDEAVEKAPSHRILAVRRGEHESFLSLRISPPEAEATAMLDSLFVKGHGPASEQVKDAVRDSYKRLLAPAMETEIRVLTKQRADNEAIRVFGENVRELLMAAPFGRRRVMAIDPGFRTGCKVVCLDEQGKLLKHDTIYPHPPQRQDEAASAKLKALCAEFKPEAIAIGNGTAGRETETFCRSHSVGDEAMVVMVNESGASVYSASKAAREEFADYDVTVRGSVSIGRRLMDPLAELVKITPKSIGVGQYQHDVDQKALKQGLDEVVMRCVNHVGVEVNTASKELLRYVSGMGPQLAEAVVRFRDEHGAFRSREQLKNVPRLGARAFEQAAGFLRIRDGENPLDAGAVHPESYPVVEAMAHDAECTVAELMRNPEKRTLLDLKKYVTEKIGEPTLKDIMEELARPGRDPREKFELFSFAEGVEKIADLAPGMKVPGIVTNVTAFGAFVDVGVHHDGLVHVSEITDRYVKNPADVVKVHQHVQATVMSVDLERKRISLSLRTEPGKPRATRKKPKAQPAPSGETKKPAHAEGRQPEKPHVRPEQRKETRHKRKPRKDKPSPHPHTPPKKEPKPFNNPFAEFFQNWKGPAKTSD